MKLFASLKARYPKVFPVVAAIVAISSVGGLAAYERRTGDCCYPGAPCCHPGAACCAKHKAQHP